MFALEETGAFSNDKSYFIPTGDLALLALLNSRLGWYFFTAVTPAVRNSWHEMRVQYVEKLPIPALVKKSSARLATQSRQCTAAARARYAIQSAVRRRILDLAPPEKRKLNGRLEDWHALDFQAFLQEVKKYFRAEIPLKQRGEWEAYLADNAREVARLSAEIAAAEAEIDRLVYAAFDLTPDEIALLEASLEGQY